MKIIKRTIALMLCLICLVSGYGCAQKEDFNVTGYIEAMLESSYKNDNQKYMGFSSQSVSEAEENNKTTVANAVVRFRNKYNLYTTDAQNDALTAAFTKAYANSKFSIRDKTETDYGYDVVINYTPQTTFLEISDQIQGIIDNSSGSSASESEENYIDKIVQLCSNMADNPSYGNSESITIDIRKDSNGVLTMNLALIDTLDINILPF